MRPVADISVLIVAYRSRATIQRCLDALAAQTVAPREVFLLENGSPTGETVDLEGLPDWITPVSSDENLGFAGGNNRLAERAAGRWLALLNPDAYPHADWIEALDAATRRYPDFALFGSTQYQADQPGLLDGSGDVYHAVGLAYRSCYMRPVSMLPPEGEVFGPCAAAALIRRDVFEALGGFDESFFCYNEDVDLAVRARLAGHRAIQLRGAKVDHTGYGSSGRRSDFATYYGVRNRLWVFLKTMPGWLLWLLAPVHALATALLGLAAFKHGQARVYARAIRDGLKAWPRIMQARRKLQAERVVRPSAYARMMCWNSRALLTREPDIRPVKPGAVSTQEVRAQ
ncbi:glycosyltransferase family 2 protein [Maricaulis sp. CAU 1757]